MIFLISAENEDKKINGGSVGTEKIDTTERQWPESQFVNKLLELTYLGNVWTSVSSKYNWIRVGASKINIKFQKINFDKLCYLIYHKFNIIMK